MGFFLEQSKQKMIGPFAVDQKIAARQAFLAEARAHQKLAGRVIADQAGGLDTVQSPGCGR